MVILIASSVLQSMLINGFAGDHDMHWFGIASDNLAHHVFLLTSPHTRSCLG
ncbi:hypothetical protein [Rosenbergiella metrosideri]|uniref:hypothetical protein n=1 Tax=Rosenbergiella metrosideri TaxID=2921185 RepID=UPI001F4FC03E